jgi:hypothetical protein
LAGIGRWAVRRPRISHDSSEDPQDPRPVLSEKGRDTLRQMVQHEDGLRDQRLGYFLTLNGFLFAALGFAWNAQHARSLVIVLAAMGILIALSSFVSMKRSDTAIRSLRKRAWVFNNGPVETDQRWELADLQSIPVSFSSQQIGDRVSGPDAEWTWERIQQPWHALPLILLSAWITILVLGCLYLSA